MNRKIVLLGDKTDHGGVVISASSSFTSKGSKMALIGDVAACPQKGHGITPINPDGPRTARNLGRYFALDKDVCGCGAKVIASGRFRSK